MEPRKKLVSSLIVLFVAVHIPYFFTHDQHWPILGFPMYSFTFKAETSCVAVYGVPEDPSKPEFRLLDGDLGIGLNHVKQAFNKMLEYPYRSADYESVAADCPAASRDERDACVSRLLVKRALMVILKDYSKSSHRPPLRALKLYRAEFEYVDGNFVGRPIELLGESDNSAVGASR
jgi:hypothetical protein